MTDEQAKIEWTDELDDKVWLRVAYSPDVGGGWREAVASDIVLALQANPDIKEWVLSCFEAERSCTSRTLPNPPESTG